MAVRRSTKKSAATLPENQTPSEQVATAIVTLHSDLAVSVNRIMEAGLGETGQLHAITLFQASLGVPGDPNRNPAIAIEAAREVVGTEPV